MFSVILNSTMKRRQLKASFLRGERPSQHYQQHEVLRSDIKGMGKNYRQMKNKNITHKKVEYLIPMFYFQ